MAKNEWGILQKYIKLYGRWIVYESLIRTSSSALDTAKPIWGYVNSVALALLNEERNRKAKQRLKEQEMTQTVSLIKMLQAVSTTGVILVGREDL